MGLQEIRNLKLNSGIPKPKKVYELPKKSAKKIAMEKLHPKVEIVKAKKLGWFDSSKVHVGFEDEMPKYEQPKGSSELQRWFEERHKEMTGFCKHCGGRTQKGKDNYKNSIAHILPKAYFPSVATNPDNNIELCFYGESCHTNFDNKMLDLTELNCFDEVISKFVKMYPSIAKEERRRIPKILLEYLETER